MVVTRAPHAPGLARLETYLRQGSWLFQGDRSVDPRETLCPGIPQFHRDRNRLRGIWAVGVGVLAPVPLVRWVFASPWAAGLMALSLGVDGTPSSRVDEFSDGRIALTIGENRRNQRDLAELLLRAEGLDDHQPVGEYCVQVVPRSALRDGRAWYPVPGEFISFDAVPVREQVDLCAGDVRALWSLLREAPRPWFDDSTQSCAAPFTGPLARGGDIQFDGRSGERARVTRLPRDSDRRAAWALASLRKRRWEGGSAAPGGGSPPSGGTVEKAMTFIDERVQNAEVREHPLEVREIARAVGMSSSRLHAAFRQTLGITPMGYAAERRLDLAERLLTETSLSVGEVSARCGFAEQSNLTQSFKRLRGITPSELRRAWRGRARV